MPRAGLLTTAACLTIAHGYVPHRHIVRFRSLSNSVSPAVGSEAFDKFRYVKIVKKKWTLLRYRNNASSRRIFHLFRLFLHFGR